MHIMVDFETLDTKPTAVVLSVGMVMFDENKIRGYRYFKFDVQTQLDAGRTVSAKTLAWWTNQSEKAREVLSPHVTDITLVTFNDQLTTWLLERGIRTEDAHVWGNGNDFDIPILNSITDEFGPFYDHWNTWCFRTFNKMTGCKQMVIRKGTHHNALDDAMYQAECVLAAWAKQRG